ncbi:MAG: hypothetical protein AAB499_00350, partial [Patescibacteria group bacterium]
MPINTSPAAGDCLVLLTIHQPPAFLDIIIKCLASSSFRPEREKELLVKLYRASSSFRPEREKELLVKLY